MRASMRSASIAEGRWSGVRPAPNTIPTGRTGTASSVAKRYVFVAARMKQLQAKTMQHVRSVAPTIHAMLLRNMKHRITEGCPGAGFDRRTSFGHELRENSEIVVREEPWPKHFLGTEKMREIRFCVGCAHS